MITPEMAGNEKQSESSTRVKATATKDVITQPPQHQGSANTGDAKTHTVKDHPTWLIITVLLATLLGNGAFWEWRSSRLAKKDSDLKQQEAHLTRVVKTTDLRKAQNDLYRQTIELSQAFAEARNAHAKAPSPAMNNKMITLTKQLELLKSDFLVLEKQLADIEGRSPRPITLEFVPPSAPKGLRIVQ